MKHLAYALAALGLLAGCGGKPSRAEATLIGTTGNFKGFPLCIEVTYQNAETLGIYPKDVCTDAAVSGSFDVTLANQADDPETEVVNGFGQVYLRGNAGEPFYGTESSREQDEDGDTATVRINVAF
jgi:hypothetical protein